MADRQTLTIDLFSTRKSVEKTLPDAVEWLQRLLAQVPKEHREDSYLSITLDYGVYDSPTELDVQIYYNRLETQEEVETREAEEKRRKEQHARHELERARANYERLRAQFG